MLANLMSWLGLHLVIEKWFNQKLCVIYFTKIHLGFFTIWPVNKEDIMC